MNNERYTFDKEFGGRTVTSNDPVWLQAQINKVKHGVDGGGDYRRALENRLHDLKQYRCPTCGGTGVVSRLIPNQRKGLK